MADEDVELDATINESIWEAVRLGWVEVAGTAART